MSIEIQNSIKTDLARREAQARIDWQHFCESMSDCPPNSNKLFNSSGGIDLSHLNWTSVAKSCPAIVELLSSEKIVFARHSHGGLYFLADPCLYVNPPHWIVRRKATQDRVQRAIGAISGLVDRAKMDFYQWLAVRSVLELLRTDICALLWNAMLLERTTNLDHGFSALSSFLERFAEFNLRYLPAYGSRPTIEAGDFGKGEVAIFGVNDLHAREIPDNPQFVRSRRASDATILLWSSIRRFILNHALPEPPTWIFGNAFGAVDMAYDLLAALRSVGYRDATASVCSVSGYNSSDAHLHRDNYVHWPAQTPGPKSIVFCDDSISSGRTFENFRQLCAERHPGIPIHTLFMTFDLNIGRDPKVDLEASFGLAGAAVSRAPWSPGLKMEIPSSTSVRRLLAKMLTSSDEKLRWLAETQQPTIMDLNHELV